MTKNVIVVDEQGNEYGATYPKRAKGLVKNGRARFVRQSPTESLSMALTFVNSASNGWFPLMQ